MRVDGDGDYARMPQTSYARWDMPCQLADHEPVASNRELVARFHHVYTSSLFGY